MQQESPTNLQAVSRTGHAAPDAGAPDPRWDSPLAPAIVWFRTDLRLDVNPAVDRAASWSRPLLALYVIDPALWDAATNRRRQALIFALTQLDEALGRTGGRLFVRRGDPVRVVPAIAASAGAAAVLWNDAVTPFGRRRDANVQRGLACPCHVEAGNWVAQPGTIRRPNGEPYQVFTPYFRRWTAELEDTARSIFTGADRPRPWWLGAPDQDAAPSISLSDDPTATEQVPGRPGNRPSLMVVTNSTFDDPDCGEPVSLTALARPGAHFLLQPGPAQAAWQHEVQRHVHGDATPENELSGGSHMSQALKWGILSARRLAMSYLHQPGAESLLRQLAWRDFFADVMFHHPETVSTEFKANYRQRIWTLDLELFEIWRAGMTGFPLVDAAMRELAETGWMHNRLRMVTASFLVKHLLVDWRLGERYFRRQLVDGDTTQNVGNWQWVAGCGVDAAPYFRIFQPVRQAHRFDPDADYVRRWIPELAKLDPKWCFEPWKRPQRGSFDDPASGYPDPIIDLAVGRERALSQYAAALKG